MQNVLSEKAKETEWEFQWKTVILSQLKCIKLFNITSIYGCSCTLKYSITVYMYVLVAINDVDLCPFQPRVLQTWRKRNDISKSQLGLYQQLQLVIHILLLFVASMKFIIMGLVASHDYKVEGLWYLCCSLNQHPKILL